MIDWNIVLYIGMVLIVFGFGLFLYSEMKEREIDRKLAENQRFIDALLRTQQLQNIRKDINEKSKTWNNIFWHDCKSCQKLYNP